MATESIWIIIANDEALDKQRELIDLGYFAEAKDMDAKLKSVAEKCKSMVSERGGSLLISTLDRQVLQVPVTVAEDFPNILEGFKAAFGPRMASGMGMSLDEAGKAMEVSRRTGQIEMYDPSDEKFKSVSLVKGENDPDPIDFEMPPNLFDPVKPKSPDPEPTRQKNKYTPGLNAQQAMEAESQMIQGIVQQLAGPAMQMQQQMQAQQQEEPGNLNEALHGEKIPGQEQNGDSEPKKEAKVPDQEQNSDEKDEGEEDESQTKLGNLLATVNDKIPQLMGMAETNPEAFKKIITLVHKIVDMAKQKKSSKTEKSEPTPDDWAAVTQELNKRMGEFPIGTVRKRRKKISIDGKASWRSMATGQLKDNKGNPISVRSSNAQADDGKEGTKQ